MNKVTLRGVIRNIKPSHKVGDIEYDRAEIITKRENGQEDVLNLKFKHFSNIYKDDDFVELAGNIRSFSRLVDGRNKVDIYVFTYFDKPDESNDLANEVELDGRVCKIEELRVLENGKQNIHLILANNLISNTQKLNSYIPCIGWGVVAKELSNLHVNDKIKVIGELHSRTYKKILDNGDVDFRVAHELFVKSVEVVNDTQL